MTAPRLPFLVKLHPDGYLVGRVGLAGSATPWCALYLNGELLDVDPYEFTDEQAAPWPDLAVAPRVAGVVPS